MSKKSLIIHKGNINSITAHSFDGTPNRVLLKNIEGWDGNVAIRRNTAEILWKEGAVHSNDALYGPRFLEVELNFQGSLSEMRSLKTKVENIANELNSLKTLSLVEYEGGSEIYREEISVRMNENGYDWDQMGDSADIVFYFVAPNPRKTVWINGAENPETGGRI